jgi:hypothetical protein
MLSSTVSLNPKLWLVRFFALLVILSFAFFSRADGLSGFDTQNNQAYFVSDGAFGGTVFFAQASNFTALPPSAYYLLPVAYLGFDPLSGSRLIAGLNVKKNFFIMEKPNWGQITYFEASLFRIRVE